MKQVFFAIIFMVSINQVSTAQKYFTKTGQIYFVSDTPMEKIEATNKSSNCVLDMASGKLEFGVLIKGFQFEKALMQEHFNENYMESNKFPKSIFKGQVDNYKNIDMSKNGKYPVKVSGDLTIHGVTQKVDTNGFITVTNGKIKADATFDIKVEDYGIKIPSLVKDKIAKSVKIKIDTTLDPFTK